MPLPLARFLNDDDRLDTFVRRTAAAGFDAKACADFLIVMRVSWMNIVAMERAMEGLSLAHAPEFDAAHLVAGIRTIEGIVARHDLVLPRDVSEFMKLPVGSSDWSAPDDVTPTVTIGADHAPIGATALLESRAYFLERSSDDTTKDQLPDLVRLGHSQYFAPVVLLTGKCLASGISDSRVILDTFYALADLALSPPLGIHGRLRRSSSWQDLHPGYRFVRLALAVKDLGPFERSRKMNPLDYEDRCAQYFGWPRPSVLLEYSATQPDPTYRQLRHAAACRLKLKYPRFFINAGLTYLDLPPDDALKEFEFEYLPLLAFSDGIGGPGPKTEMERLLERLSGAYLQSLGWSIVITGNPDGGPHLNPGIRCERYLTGESGESVESAFSNYLRKHLRFTDRI